MIENNNNVFSNRSNVIDYLKGIAAVFVVVGHSITYLRNYNICIPIWMGWIGVLVSSVHVPLFFLVSGYLCHRQHYGKYIKKKVIRILIPYITFAVLKLLFNLFISNEHMHGSSLTYSLYDTFVLGGAYWFVYCILIIFIIAPIGWKRTTEKLNVYNIRIQILIVLLIVFNVFNIDFGFSMFPDKLIIGSIELETPFFQIERVIMYFPYFLVGMLIAQNSKSFFDMLEKYKKIVLSVAIVLIACVSFFVVNGTISKGYFPKMIIAFSLMIILYNSLKNLKYDILCFGVCGRFSLQIMFFDSLYRVLLYAFFTRIIGMYSLIAFMVAFLDVIMAVVSCQIIKKIPIIRVLFGL